MGALSNLSPMIYGAARGVQDVNREDREQQAFDSDQEIRKVQLDDAKTLGPIRRRSAELGVEAQEHALIRRPTLEKREDELSSLNIDVAKLKLDDQKVVTEEAKVARTKQNRLRDGLSRFHQSSNPQDVVDAIREIYPETAGNSAARRNSDGSITLIDGEGSDVYTMKGRKWEDGREMSPDDELTYYAYNMMDPVKAFQKKWDHAQKSDIEGQKADSRLAVAMTNSESRVRAAEGRSTRDRERRVTSDVRLSESILDRNLRTTSIPGHYQNVYSSEDDAKLRRIMSARAGELIRKDDMEPEKAVNTAIEEVRGGFAKAKQESTAAANELLGKKLDPRNAAQMQAEAKAGNAAAKSLIAALGRMRTAYGDDVARYLYDQLPSKKK